MKLGIRTGRVLGLALLLIVALVTSTCEDPTGVQLDITGISETVNGHFHRCTIPGRDITSAPPEGRTYTSTTDAGHSHTVTLNQTQLLDLQQPNATLNVRSEPSSDPSDPHRHNVLFQN